MTEKVNENSTNLFRKMYIRIPEFCLSHWLLRIPLAVVFVQQGLSKFPVTAEDAEAFELPFLRQEHKPPNTPAPCLPQNPKGW